MENDFKKTLGIYWGRKSIFLTQSIAGETHFSTSIPFSSDSKDSDFNPFSVEGSDLVSNLTTTLQQNKITADHIYLSLPTKDIIFRSFIIPWMQRHEIADVVEFEASKYIPFSLEELSYSFNSMDTLEGTTKRIRIVFAAIKQTTLDTYNALLEQAGVTIRNVEPSPISLLRSLVKNEEIAAKETFAIIEKDETNGKIIIAHNLTPLFVREFQLTPPGADQNDIDDDAIISRLKNEIRISLDYFIRQESNLTISQLLLICESVEAEQTQNELEKSTGIPTKHIDINTYDPNLTTPSIENINSLGASLHDEIENINKFDLMDIQEVETPRIEFDIKNIDFKTFNYKLISAVIAGCFLISGGVFGHKQLALSQKQKIIAGLEQQLGKNKTRSAESIENKTQIIEKKISIYRSVRKKGDFTNFLTSLTKALPESAWLENIQLSYSKQRTSRNSQQDDENENPQHPIQVSLTGYVHTPDRQEHIDIITKFVNNLEKDPLIAKYFRRVGISSVSQKTYSGFPSSSFTLNFIQP